MTLLLSLFGGAATLLVMGLAYMALFLGLHLVSMRSELAARKIRTLLITRGGGA